MLLRCLAASLLTQVLLGLRVLRPPVLRQGVVLVSQPGEHNHFLYEQAVFLYEYTQRGSKAVILERPTAFTMGEISPGERLLEASSSSTNGVSQELECSRGTRSSWVRSGRTSLDADEWLGGDQGGDMAIMLHPYAFTEQSKECGAGIFLGGMRQARELVTQGKASPKDFKFFFNGIEWPPGQLEQEVEQGRWDVVEVSSDLILRQSSATTLWHRARKEIELSRSLEESRQESQGT